MDPDPTHTLVDPDLQNAPEALDWSGFTKPESNGHGCRKMGRFWTDPVHTLHKRKKKVRFRPFPFFVLSLLRLLSSSYPTPNPNNLKSRQNSFIHGLICSYYCSKHESCERRWSSPLKRREPLNLDGSSSNCSDPLFFGWNRCKTVRIRFDSHSLWIRKRFFDFFKWFCVRVRVLDRTAWTCYGFTSFEVL